MSNSNPIKIMCHGRQCLSVASEFGWLPGARYTNLRDLRGYESIGLIDIDWRNYNFQQHYRAVMEHRPHLTVARDVEDLGQLDEILIQAEKLSTGAERVIVVPKDERLSSNFSGYIPEEYLLGYSVPTRYGGTSIAASNFEGRQVHLLGGRPDVQIELADTLDVYSLDSNRITLDARFGDYFIGTQFKPHPTGGYYECIRASLSTIVGMWEQREKRRDEVENSNRE